MVHLGPYCNILNCLRILLYTGLTVLCLYCSSHTLAKYLAAETIILTGAEDQPAILFPSITFCRKNVFDDVRQHLCFLCYAILLFIKHKEHLHVSSCDDVPEKLKTPFRSNPRWECSGDGGRVLRGWGGHSIHSRYLSPQGFVPMIIFVSWNIFDKYGGESR